MVSSWFRREDSACRRARRHRQRLPARLHRRPLDCIAARGKGAALASAQILAERPCGAWLPRRQLRRLENAVKRGVYAVDSSLRLSPSLRRDGNHIWKRRRRAFQFRYAPGMLVPVTQRFAFSRSLRPMYIHKLHTMHNTCSLRGF